MASVSPAWIDKVRNIALYGRGFVGIDIGSSSTKIVQLSIRDGLASVDTYGMISNTAYADAEIGASAYPSVEAASGEISDLMHEIGALSRRGAVSIPFSETLMQIIPLPKRDPEQMSRIIPVEAQKFIPRPINEIMLDWYAISDEESNAFESMKPHSETEKHFQNVMLVGINKQTASRFITIVAQSSVTSEFCEIEAFSAARASLHAKKAPTLIMDFGASSTKIFFVDQHWVLLGGRVIPIGGETITKAIREKLHVEFAEAEKMKSVDGLQPGKSTSAIIQEALAPFWNYTNQFLEEEERILHKKIEHVLIMGGGAYMPGLIDHLQTKLKLPVEKLAGFGRTKGPLILEDTFKEDGPLYAVAAGLALRGIGM